MQNALLSGFLTAFLYGEMGTYGDVLRESAGRAFKLPDKSFAVPDWSQTTAVLKIMLANDQRLIRGLLGVIGMRTIKNEAQAMAEYFSPSQKAMEFLNNYTISLANVEVKETLQEATRLMKDVIEQGMSLKQAEVYLETKLTQFSETRVKAIARTEGTRAFNAGTLKESLESDVVVGYRFNAVLDMLTTDICRERNNTFIAKEDIAAMVENTPPLHVNCRSNLEIVTKYSKRRAGYTPIHEANITTEVLKRPEDRQATHDLLR